MPGLCIFRARTNRGNNVRVRQADQVELREEGVIFELRQVGLGGNVDARVEGMYPIFGAHDPLPRDNVNAMADRDRFWANLLPDVLFAKKESGTKVFFCHILIVEDSQAPRSRKHDVLAGLGRNAAEIDYEDGTVPHPV